VDDQGSARPLPLHTLMIEWPSHLMII